MNMDKENLTLAKTLMKQTSGSNAKTTGDHYVNIAQQSSLAQQSKLLKILLSQRNLPKHGWSDLSIQSLLNDLSLMDSNNFVSHEGSSIGIGEREGRVFNKCLVKQRHFSFSHGIGRSGNISAHQPKAAGSSLLQVLTNYLVLHAIKLSGATKTKKSICLPMCTGMTLNLVLLTLKSKKPNAKYVIWPRIDQLSCFKCIKTANLEPVVIENVHHVHATTSNTTIFQSNLDAVTTDLEAIKKAINTLGPENIVCVLSTTSCFAPRIPDRIIDISKICHQHGIAHICNNAYGVQSSKIMNHINTCLSNPMSHRLDAFIQSTDKNFMVPVGGAIVASANPSFIDEISNNYAGRASLTPIMDLFITLLSMGEEGWCKLLKDREQLLPIFKQKVEKIAQRFGERLLDSSQNNISFAITLDKIPNNTNPNELGSHLFYRGVTGPRVVKKDVQKNELGFHFSGYGSHCNNYPHHYLTMACAIGISMREIEQFEEILQSVMKKLYNLKGDKNI